MLAKHDFSGCGCGLYRECQPYCNARSIIDAADPVEAIAISLWQDGKQAPSPMAHFNEAKRVWRALTLWHDARDKPRHPAAQENADE